MMLSPHFSLAELVASSTAARLGLDNSPSDGIVTCMRTTAEKMEEVRRVLGGRPIHIDSGYRCEALERVLCEKDYQKWCIRHKRDAKTSWQDYLAGKAHPKGWAVDFTCREAGTPFQIVRALKDVIQYDQLIMEGGWVHISFDPRMRQKVLTAFFGTDGPSYSGGLV